MKVTSRMTLTKWRLDAMHESLQSVLAGEADYADLEIADFEAAVGWVEAEMDRRAKIPAYGRPAPTPGKVLKALEAALGERVQGEFNAEYGAERLPRPDFDDYDKALDWVHEQMDREAVR